MVEATEKPVIAKIRIGWDNQHINGVAVAQLIQKAGASALCVHGRTADQSYAGKVNWTIMKQIKEKVKIPVIANGDVTSYKWAVVVTKNQLRPSDDRQGSTTLPLGVS